MIRFVDTLKVCREGTFNQNEVTNLLVGIQNDVTYKFFRGCTNEQIQNGITEIWKFLLFAASSSVSSVRLSSYRATGSFVIKISPYYPEMINNTFSDVAMFSTIDIQSSAILAATFSFITNIIPTQHLQQFLDKTPVFHHFAISDPIFSEHLATIIGRLKRLGYPWMHTLLCSFMESIHKSSDRYLFKSISSIVSHYPIPLMKAVIEFLHEKQSVSNHLSLVSFLLSSVEMDFDQLDLFSFADASMSILENFSNCTSVEIDSAFQVLGICTSSFKVIGSVFEENQIKLELQNSSTTRFIIISFEQFKNRPSFYMLPMPIQFLTPLESDGTLLATTKLNTLGILARTPQNTEMVLNIFANVLSKPYDDKTSSCIQSLSNCLGIVYGIKSTFSLLQKILFGILFSEPTSWFHAYYILKVIKVLTPKMAYDLFGTNGIGRITNVLLNFCFNQNEKVWKEAIDTLSVFIFLTSSEEYFLKVVSRLDIFNESQSKRVLDILLHIMKRNPDFRNECMISPTASLLIETFSFFESDLSALCSIFLFLSENQFSKFSSKQLSPLIKKAIAIISASVTLFTGQEFDSSIDLQLISWANELVLNDMLSKNYDIISSNSLHIEEFLHPLVSSLRFLNAVPINMIEKALVLNIVNKVSLILPQECSELLKRAWPQLPDFDKFYCFETGLNVLQKNSQPSAIGVWCHLFLSFYSSSTEIQLSRFRNMLHEIIGSFFSYHDTLTDDTLVSFICLETVICKDLNHVTVLLNEINIKRKNSILKKIGKTSPTIYEKLTGEKYQLTMIQSGSTLFSQERYLDLDANDIIQKKFYEDFVSKNDYGNFYIKTQLRESYRTFSEEDLYKLIDYYIVSNDKYGIQMVFRYMLRNNICLSFKGISFPESQAYYAYQYLKKINSPEISVFVESFMYSKDISLFSTFVLNDPDKYLNSLLNLDKIKKDQLIQLAQVIQRVPMKIDILYSIITKSIEKSTSTRRYSLVLIVFASIIFMLKSFPFEWVDFILERLKIIGDNAPSSQMSKLISNITDKVSFDKSVGLKISSYIKSIGINTCGNQSVEICCLYKSISQIEPSSRLVQLIPDVLTNFLSSSLPSVFTSGVSLLNHCLGIMPENQSNEVLRKYINQILERQKEMLNYKNATIATVLLLSRVFTLSSLSSHHFTILRMIERVLPSHNMAAASDYYCLLSRFIVSSPPQSEYLRYLSSFSETLLTQPMSFVLFSHYLSALHERAQKINPPQQRDIFITDSAASWLDKIKLYDSVYLEEMIYKWIEILLSESCEQGLPLVSFQFFKSIPRFFPLIVALGKYMKKCSNQDRKDVLMSYLKNASAMIQVECHSTALLMFTQGGDMKSILDLARFDKDNDESRALCKMINKN